MSKLIDDLRKLSGVESDPKPAAEPVKPDPEAVAQQIIATVPDLLRAAATAKERVAPLMTVDRADIDFSANPIPGQATADNLISGSAAHKVFTWCVANEIPCALVLRGSTGFGTGGGTWKLIAKW